MNINLGTEQCFIFKVTKYKTVNGPHIFYIFTWYRNASAKRSSFVWMNFLVVFFIAPKNQMLNTFWGGDSPQDSVGTKEGVVCLFVCLFFLSIVSEVGISVRSYCRH